MQLRSERGALSSNAVEKSAMRKIYLRLLPFAVLSYILAYVDRINISFAALTMRGEHSPGRISSFFKLIHAFPLRQASAADPRAFDRTRAR